MPSSIYDNAPLQKCEVPARPLSVYEQHTEALKEWIEACHDFQRADQRKAQARGRLEQYTKELHAHMEGALTDPTAPPNIQERAYRG